MVGTTGWIRDGADMAGADNDRATVESGSGGPGAEPDIEVDIPAIAPGSEFHVRGVLRHIECEKLLCTGTGSHISIVGNILDQGIFYPGTQTRVIARRRPVHDLREELRRRLGAVAASLLVI